MTPYVRGTDWPKIWLHSQAMAGKVHDLMGTQQSLLTRCLQNTSTITDSEGRVIAVMAGQPDNPQWPELAEQAADMLEEL